MIFEIRNEITLIIKQLIEMLIFNVNGGINI